MYIRGDVRTAFPASFRADLFEILRKSSESLPFRRGGEIRPHCALPQELACRFFAAHVDRDGGRQKGEVGWVAITECLPEASGAPWRRVRAGPTSPLFPQLPISLKRLVEALVRTPALTA
jgi:hypothetical protein